MYLVKRSDNLEETLRVEYKDNALEVTCKMNISKQMKEYTKANRKVSLMMSKSRNGEEINSSLIGDNLASLFIITFGEEQTQKLIDFYEGDVVSLLIDTMPFFNDVVTPMFAKARSEKISAMKKNAKMRRKFR